MSVILLKEGFKEADKIEIQIGQKFFKTSKEVVLKQFDFVDKSNIELHGNVNDDGDLTHHAEHKGFEFIYGWSRTLALTKTLTIREVK